MIYVPLRLRLRSTFAVTVVICVTYGYVWFGCRLLRFYGSRCVYHVTVTATHTYRTLPVTSRLFGSYLPPRCPVLVPVDSHFLVHAVTCTFGYWITAVACRITGSLYRTFCLRAVPHATFCSYARTHTHALPVTDLVCFTRTFAFLRFGYTVTGYYGLDSHVLFGYRFLRLRTVTWLLLRFIYLHTGLTFPVYGWFWFTVLPAGYNGSPRPLRFGSLPPHRGSTVYGCHAVRSHAHRCCRLRFCLCRSCGWVGYIPHYGCCGSAVLHTPTRVTRVTTVTWFGYWLRLVGYVLPTRCRFTVCYTYTTAVTLRTRLRTHHAHLCLALPGCLVAGWVAAHLVATPARLVGWITGCVTFPLLDTLPRVPVTTVAVWFTVAGSPLLPFVTLQFTLWFAVTVPLPTFWILPLVYGYVPRSRLRGSHGFCHPGYTRLPYRTVTTHTGWLRLHTVGYTRCVYGCRVHYTSLRLRLRFTGCGCVTVATFTFVAVGLILPACRLQFLPGCSWLR